MKRVPISELKARLSEYLASVRAGEEILVTDRGRPVARIAPVKSESGIDGQIDRLVRTGQVTPPADPDATVDPADLAAMRPSEPGAGVVDALLEDRRDGP
jgi:prevent-host-death family protein